MTYQKKYRILLVDDNKLFLKALRMQLSDLLQGQIEYIDEAYNGEEAIERVGKKSYSIIFMDIDMPKMNGIEATKYINQNFSHILVIALSLYDDFQYIEKMLRSGSRTYLVKDNLDDEALLKVFDMFSKYSYL